MLDRRKFLQLAGLGGASLVLARRAFSYPFPQTPKLAKFIQELPGLGAGIPVASPIKKGNRDYYQITMRQFRQRMHPHLPETTFWGYADATNTASPVSRYLGAAIVAQRGRPVEVTWVNELPNAHPLPVDTSLPGAEPGQPVNRTVPHLHGGFVFWTSDGGPMTWFTPGNKMVGEDFVTSHFEYPNDQSARLMWYHDHAMGITRLNAYAGLAAPYILRDELEDLLIQQGVLPSGPYEVPLVIQDKAFNKDGSLGYPNEYDKGRWAYGPDDPEPANVGHPSLPIASCVPEFFGDTIMVNGAVYPMLKVEPRPYRFRVLNGSQARFYNLQLYYAANGAATEPNLRKAGPPFLQIGTEGGFQAPVIIDPATRFSVKMDASGNPIPSTMKYSLLMAPGERADLIIDFSGVPAGSKLILYNDAPAPFPTGDPRNDHHNPESGPDTRTLMQIVVGSGTPAPQPRMAETLNNYLTAADFGDLNRAAGGATMDKTLNEDYDDYGRLIQRIGTTTSRSVNNQGDETYALALDDPATEVVRGGDVQIWRIFNLTGDTHPMHFHLVNVQVHSRAMIDETTLKIIPGTSRGPDANERGMKETVRMNPGEVTEVIIKFDLPKVSGPVSKRTGGYNYVWHCHILEHEEHDMMRPLIVKP